MAVDKGPKAAADLLSRIPGRDKVLKLIEEKDPNMAQVLKAAMITIDDLRFITPAQLAELLREIKIDDLGLALRLAGPEVRHHLLKNVSTTTREELSALINGKAQLVTRAQEAMERVMKVVRAKVDSGQLILRADEQMV